MSADNKEQKIQKADNSSSFFLLIDDEVMDGIAERKQEGIGDFSEDGVEIKPFMPNHMWQMEQGLQKTVLEHASTELEAATERESKFIYFISVGDWVAAKALFETENGLEIGVEEERGNGENIFNLAADFLVSIRKRSDLAKSDFKKDDKASGDEDAQPAQIAALNWLVDKAIEKNVAIKINYDRYVGPLHLIAYYLPASPAILAFLDKLLKIAKPEDLNVYDVYGKTPLLEAIESGNTPVALRLLDHPAVDVNLFKMVPILRCPVKVEPGVATFAAAKKLKRGHVVKKIIERGDYNPNISYVDISNEILEHMYFAFAAQGNPDSLRVLLKQYGADLLLTRDSAGWTMLHVACYTKNVPVAGFLLNKQELDKALGEGELGEEEYSEFVNAMTGNYRSAIDVGLETDISVLQAELFLRCPHFDVNKPQDLGHQPLLHMAVRNNWIEIIQLMIKFRHADVDFTARNSEGDTALRLACLEGHSEIVKIFAELCEAGVTINPNDYGHKAKIAELLGYFAEESWFGETAQVMKADEKTSAVSPLSVEDLVQVYESGEPLKVMINYNKTILDVIVDFPAGISEKEQAEVRRCVKYAIQAVEDLDVACLDRPAWFESLETGLWNDIYWSLVQGEWQESIAGTKSISIAYKKSTGESVHISITQHRERTENVSEPGTIDYEFLEGIVSKRDTGNLAEEDKDPLTTKKYEPLLELVAKKEDIPVFAALLNFPGINLSGFLASGGRGKRGIDSAVAHSPEMQRLLEEALKKQAPPFANVFDDSSDEKKAESVALDRKDAVPAAIPAPQYEAPEAKYLEERKKDPIPKELAKKLEQDKDGALNRFYKAFATKVAVFAQMETARKFHKRKDEVTNRRLDALARLVEGNGVCAAVCFECEKILISSNAPDKNAQQIALINRVMDYFAAYAKNEFQTPELQKQHRFELLLEACSLKHLGNLHGQRKQDFSALVKPFLNFLMINYAEVVKLKITLDPVGELSEKSLTDILNLCENVGDNELRTALKPCIEKMRKTDMLAKSYQSYLKIITKTAVKAISDIKKIENSLLSSDPAKAFAKPLVDAFKDRKFEIIDLPVKEEKKAAQQSAKGKKDKKSVNIEVSEEVHAEMRLINYLMSQSEYSPVKKYYLGISKLCCSHCSLVVEHLANFTKQYGETGFATRGMHGEGYPLWPLPSFMKTVPEFKALFGVDAGLVAAFEAAYNQNATDCLNIVKHLGNLVSLKRRFKKDYNQEHDWSTSAPPISIDTTVADSKKVAAQEMKGESKATQAAASFFAPPKVAKDRGSITKEQYKALTGLDEIVSSNFGKVL